MIKKLAKYFQDDSTEQINNFKRRTFLVIDLKDGKILVNPNSYDFIAEQMHNKVEHVYLEKGFAKDWSKDIITLIPISKITITISEIELMYVQKVKYILEQ